MATTSDPDCYPSGSSLISFGVKARTLLGIGGSANKRAPRLSFVRQVDHIRHWDIVEGSYEDAPDIKAHWHIDPPYDNAAGSHYPENDIDRKSLAEWCRERLGWVQVCENDGATWLPFKPFSILNTCRARGYSVEAIYEIGNWPQRRRPTPDRRRRGRRPSTSDRRTRAATMNTRHSRRAS